MEEMCELVEVMEEEEREVVTEQSQVLIEQNVEIEKEAAWQSKLEELNAMLGCTNRQCDMVMKDCLDKSNAEFKIKIRAKEDNEIFAMECEKQLLLEKIKEVEADNETLLVEIKTQYDQFQIELIQQKHLEMEADNNLEILNWLKRLNNENNDLFTNIDEAIHQLDVESVMLMKDFEERKKLNNEELEDYKLQIRAKEDNIKQITEQYDMQIDELKREIESSEKVKNEWLDKKESLEIKQNEVLLELKENETILGKTEKKKFDLQVMIDNIDLEALRKTLTENKLDHDKVLDDMKMDISKATERLNNATSTSQNLQVEIDEKTNLSEQLEQQLLNFEEEFSNLQVKKNQLKIEVENEKLQLDSNANTYDKKLKEAAQVLSREKQRCERLLQQEVVNDQMQVLLNDLTEKLNNLIDEEKNLKDSIAHDEDCTNNLKISCEKMENEISSNLDQLNALKVEEEQNQKSYVENTETLNLKIESTTLELAKLKNECTLMLEEEIKKRDSCKKIIEENRTKRKEDYREQIKSLKDELIRQKSQLENEILDVQILKECFDRQENRNKEIKNKLSRETVDKPSTFSKLSGQVLNVTQKEPEDAGVIIDLDKLSDSDHELDNMPILNAATFWEEEFDKLKYDNF